MNVCSKCGTEVEGIFCPKCGTKMDSVNIENETTYGNSTTQELKPDANIVEDISNDDNKPDNANAAQASIKDFETKVVNSSIRNKSKTGKNKDKNTDKVPWFLSLWFILIVFALSSIFLLGIPAAILVVIRLVKYKKNRGRAVIVLVVSLIIPVAVTAAIGGELHKENTYDKLISSGKYDEAIAFAEKEKSGDTDFRYYVRMAEIYAAQNMYDKSMDILIEYSEKTEVRYWSPGYANLLNKYKENVSADYAKIIESIINRYTDYHEEEERKKAEEQKQESQKHQLKQAETKTTNQSKTEAGISNNAADNDYEYSENQASNDIKDDPYGFTKEWLKNFGFDLSSIPDSELADCFCYYAYACASVVKEQKGYKNMSELRKDHMPIFVDGIDDFKAIHKVYEVNNNSNEKLREVFFDLADFTGSGIEQIIDMCSAYATGDTGENSDVEGKKVEQADSTYITAENYREWFRNIRGGEEVIISLKVYYVFSGYPEATNRLMCWVTDKNNEVLNQSLYVLVYGINVNEFLSDDIIEVKGYVRGRQNNDLLIDATNVIIK